MVTRRMIAATFAMAGALLLAGCGSGAEESYGEASELHAALDEAKGCSLVETDVDEEDGVSLSTFDCRASALPGSDYNTSGAVVMEGELTKDQLAEYMGGPAVLVGDGWVIGNSYALTDEEEPVLITWLEDAQETLGGEVVVLD